MFRFFMLPTQTLICFVLMLPALAQADSPQLVSIELFPQNYTISSVSEPVQLVVLGNYSDGTIQDLTLRSELTVSDPKCVSVSDGILSVSKNGKFSLSATYKGKSVKNEFSVDVANFHPLPSFEDQVLPVMFKHGCSTGACHGAPHGKGAFRLSLRGYDSEWDAGAIIRGNLGRRVRPMSPSESLLLKMPLMQVHHGGGSQITINDHGYQVLIDWISVGVPVEKPATERVLERIEIYPPSGSVLHLDQGELQVNVQAHYVDGSTEDITRLASLLSTDDFVASINDTGMIRCDSRGEFTILVEYNRKITTATYAVLGEVEGYHWVDKKQHNYIDHHVDVKLKKLQFKPADLCTDSEFIRRVYLDITGLLPSAGQAKAFLDDKHPEKREKLIDQLLESHEYTMFWSLKWGDLLRMSEKQVGKEGLPVYHNWVHDAVKNNLPYDQFVKQLITSTGHTSKIAPANFFRTEHSTEDVVETTAQTFMGVRIGCAKCHNHPFEKWTQDQYYGLSAFFNRVNRKRIEEQDEEVDKKSGKKRKKGPKRVYYEISMNGEGEVKHPATGIEVAPWVPGGNLKITNDSDRRGGFADWLTKPENPFFAKAEVNRIWAYLLGRGIVEPFDDFRESNPPVNNELLEALAADFVKHEYDRKYLIKQILNSRTYQASSYSNPFNEDDHKYFSHYFARRMDAEQLLDAISDVTGVKEAFPGHKQDVKATQLIAPDLAKNDFLKMFGQPERQTACACERAKDPSLPQALALYNGTVLQNKIKNQNNRFYKLLKEEKQDEEIVRILYLSAFARYPNEQELSIALGYLEEHKTNRNQAFEDLCWAILNRNEFMFQH